MAKRTNGMQSHVAKQIIRDLYPTACLRYLDDGFCQADAGAKIRSKEKIILGVGASWEEVVNEARARYASEHGNTVSVYAPKVEAVQPAGDTVLFGSP